MNDQLILEDLEFSCSIGVTTEEQAQKQPIIIDIMLGFDNNKAAKNDDINDAINYVHVFDATKELVEGKSFHLIETMAEELATTLLDTFNISSVDLLVKKPRPIEKRGGKWAGVRIIRP